MGNLETGSDVREETGAAASLLPSRGQIIGRARELRLSLTGPRLETCGPSPGTTGPEPGIS